MAYKTRKSKPVPGYSFIEILLFVAILSILSGFIFFYFSPSEAKSRARDERRLADLVMLERAILEYKLVNEILPDISDTLRNSAVLPETSSGQIFDANSGWISADLSLYLTKLPIDPLNEAPYVYTYQHDGYSYEINASLEYYAVYAQEDGGNNAAVYEVGDNLSII